MIIMTKDNKHNIRCCQRRNQRKNSMMLSKSEISQDIIDQIHNENDKPNDASSLFITGLGDNKI